MVSAVILVAELEWPSSQLDELDFIGGTKTDIGTFPGPEIADDCLDKCTEISRRAVVHFKNDGRVAIVFYRHSSAEIICGCHAYSITK